MPSEASFSDWTTRVRICCRSMNWPIWLPRLAIISSVAVVDRPDLAAEELEHAQAIALEQDRHGEAGVQAGRLGGRRPPEEVGVVGDVRDPLGLRARPRRGRGGRIPSSRLDLPGHGLEPRTGPGPAGCQSAAHRSRCACGSTRQNAPRSQSRLVPIVSRICGPASLERVGLGQHAGRLVLGRQPPLGLLAPGDVVEDDHAPLDRPALVPQRAAGDQDPGPVLAAGIGDVELRLVDRLAADGPVSAAGPRRDRA